MSRRARAHRHIHRLALRVCSSLLLLAGGAPTLRAETRTLVAGPQYKAGGGHRTLWGNDYRDLWTTPVELEILDLKKEAGGLTPVRRVGGQQTKGLALRGADGRNYTFRGLDKDATELIEEDLRGTIVERLLQDQTAAQHPASEVVARVILDAVGVPCPAWRLVVMPDDASLGEFRQVFAGAIGVFAEYPSAVSDKNPGFRGITEIVDHLGLYKRLEAGEGDRIDERAFLKARLVDIFMGDWDRHRKQWRWAKLPGSALWQPIPEDRDQAFSRYEGFILDQGRRRDPRFQKLRAEYPGISGLTTNGWEQDRRLLVGLPEAEFKAAAEALRAQLTDGVLESAARAMPDAWYRLDGTRLTAILEARRDKLPEIAARYYRYLADRVDVYLTNQTDLVTAARQPSGDMDVRVWRAGADGKPTGDATFQRTFHGNETDEVRFYALEGNDRLVVSGGGGINVRMIGGPGADTLDATGSGDARLSDASGTSSAKDASVDARAYNPPPPPKNAPWIPPRDWGRQTFTAPWLSFGSDIGGFVGYGFDTRTFGFRKDPYANRQIFRAGYAFGEQSAKVEYRGEFRRENRPSYWGLYAYGSGVEVQRFYGLGNETENAGNEDYYKAHSNELVLYPSLTLRLGGRKAHLTVGPLLKFNDTDVDRNDLVSLARPYGTGEFGEVGAHAVLAYDGRDSIVFPRRGVFAAVRGSVFPEAWDVASTFGQVNGNVNGYFSAGKVVTLAVRAGGARVFGTAPFQNAAYLGAGTGLKALEQVDYTLRGFRSHRFGGDSSLWGNADLRLRVSRITLFLPAHWGVLGFVDSGRVWRKGESSDTWHTGVGGGIWLSFLNDRTVFSGGIAHSKEENALVYFKGGFTF